MTNSFFSIDINSWLINSFIVIILYMIVSNLLWLFLGSRLLQFLPGINIKGFSGTLKIAAMIVLAITGAFYWLFIYSISLGKNKKPEFTDEVSKMIQRGSRIFIQKK